MIKAFYQTIRKLLPPIVNKNITRLLYLIKIKPTVNMGARNSLSKGVVVFSADFEMAWAFRYSKTVEDANQMGLQERNNFPQILSLFNQHKIPVTWATVGHLFLDKCERNKEEAHPEMNRPSYFENRNWKFKKGDWYDHDPCTNLISNPAWYAPDLIDKILLSPIDHEIACHTFSHIDFSYQNCSTDLAKSEIAACLKLASKKNISLTSMVFPGGTAGNFGVLMDHGFTAYRKPFQYDIDIPFMDKNGLVAIPSSHGLDGVPELYSASTYISLAKSFVVSALKNKLVCHFWFHPSMNPWYMKNVLPALLDFVAEYRDKGNIEIMTMRDLASQTLQGE